MKDIVKGCARDFESACCERDQGQSVKTADYQHGLLHWMYLANDINPRVACVQTTIIHKAADHLPPTYAVEFSSHHVTSVLVGMNLHTWPTREQVQEWFLRSD